MVTYQDTKKINETRISYYNSRKKTGQDLAKKKKEGKEISESDIKKGKLCRQCLTPACHDENVNKIRAETSYRWICLGNKKKQVNVTEMGAVETSPLTEESEEKRKKEIYQQDY